MTDEVVRELVDQAVSGLEREIDNALEQLVAPAPHNGHVVESRLFAMLAQECTNVLANWASMRRLGLRVELALNFLDHAQRLEKEGPAQQAQPRAEEMTKQEAKPAPVAAAS